MPKLLEHMDLVNVPLMTPSHAGDLPHRVKFGQHGLPPEEKPWADESTASCWS